MTDFSGPRPSVEEVARELVAVANDQDKPHPVGSSACYVFDEERIARLRAAVASLEKPPESLRKLDVEQVARWFFERATALADDGDAEFHAAEFCSTFGVPEQQERATASSECPYCGVATPHHHDLCPSCGGPAVQVEITEGRCKCLKDDDGVSIHGRVSYDYCQERGWEWGICWSCFLQMPSKRWVHSTFGAPQDRTPTTVRALADLMEDWWTPSNQDFYHGHYFALDCDECRMGLAAHLLRHSSLSLGTTKNEQEK